MDLDVWLALILTACGGIALTRFNPTIMSSRAVLYSLTVIAVAGAAALLLIIVLWGGPVPTPSGVANPDGG